MEASYISLKKALWCYANGKRRTETGWEEENYIHISLEGIIRIDSKLDEFRGITRYILTTHSQATQNTEVSLREEFTYDKQERLLTHTHQVNGGTSTTYVDG